MKMIVVLASLLLVGAGEKRPVLLFLGDSITGGFGVAPSENYPSLVAERLKAGGWDFAVENESRKGDTAAEALDRAHARLKRPVDVLVVALGTNDALQGVAPSRTEKSLRRIVELAYAANPRARVVIVGARAPLEAGAYARQFNAIFRKVAWEYRTAYLPFILEDVVDVRSLTLADRIHPNAAGHKVMAERVWGVLEPLMKKSFPPPSPVPAK